MSDSTPRLKLGELVDGQELDAMTINDALVQLDALTDLYLKGQFVNTPPSSPADGDIYLLGAAPTGLWTGRAYKIAYCIDGLWRFFTPFDGLRGFIATTNAFIVYQAGSWIDANALISGHEASIASAATCDLGAAGSLCVTITGTTAITALGTGANLLRFVRFAGALTLTHNATSLILPGAVNIATAAGDTAVFSSDPSGNWRCRGFTRASGVPLNVASVTGSGRMVLDAAPNFTGPVGIGMTPANVLDVTQTQNALSLASVLNASTGAGSQVGYRASNGTSRAFLVQTGTGYAASGVYRSDGAYLYAEGAGGLTLTTGTTQPIYFAINSSECARFGTDGSFLVGGTANGGWQGTAKTEVQAGNGKNALSAYSSSSGADAAFIVRVDNVSAYLSVFFKNTAAVGSITTNGTSTAYNTASDARRKAVCAAQADYRDAIRALWVGDFTWKESGAPGFGVLAQQAWEVMPNHAGVTKPVDEDGVWQASAEPFAFLALWGVKDLYAAIAALSARVAALEVDHAAG